MPKSKIAGKYLAELDPSSEIAKVKIASSLNNYRPSFIGAISNPEIQFNQVTPQAAFNSTDLGF